MGRKPNPWMVYVKKFRAENPDIKYKDILILAKETYVKKK